MIENITLSGNQVRAFSTPYFNREVLPIWIKAGILAFTISIFLPIPERNSGYCK